MYDKLFNTKYKVYKKLYNENISGLNAFVYHRTSSIDSINNIIKTGFKAGLGEMYGTGLYTTYDIHSQLTSQMEHVYGKYIIKFKVNLFKCLILNYNQAKKVYGKDYNLLDQLKKLNINVDIPRLYDYTDKLFNEKFTSDIALKLLEIPEIRNKIEGIVFTGRRDGNVCVIYNSDIAIPISYTMTNLNADNFYVLKKIQTNEVIEVSREAVESMLQSNNNGWFEKTFEIIKEPQKQYGSKPEELEWTKITTLQNVRKSIDSMNKLFITNVAKTPAELYHECNYKRLIKVIEDNELKIPGSVFNLEIKNNIIMNLY